VKFKVGDRIRQGNVVKEITKVRETGYTWKYPYIPDKDWWSEARDDPFFERGWDLIQEDGE
jgi:hypothetical protein